MSENNTNSFPDSNELPPEFTGETPPESSEGGEKKSGRKKKSSSEGKSDKDKQSVKTKTVYVPMKFSQSAIGTIKAGISTPVSSRSSVIDIAKTAISRLTPKQIVTIINHQSGISQAENNDPGMGSNTADQGDSDDE